MLRFGLTLLFPSSLTVILRTQQIPFFDGPTVRMFCLFGLALSFLCFVGEYGLMAWTDYQRDHAHRLSRPRLAVFHFVAESFRNAKI
jgi:hypothetical protein